ncbi:MAG: hypothetical protein AABN95_01185 [Acidobacteriota bacterium]
MAFRTEKEAWQVRYLLGDLSEQENVGIEDSYFADDNSFQDLEIVEDELVDAYVRDELTGAQRQQFEKLLQSSARLAGRVHFARILVNRVASMSLATGTAAVVSAVVAERPVTVTWWQKIFAPQAGRKFAFAGSTVVVLMVAALLFAWMRLRESSQRLERERAVLQQQSETLNAQSNEQTSRINQLAADLERERKLRAEDQKLIESLRNDSANQTASPSRVIAFLSLTPQLTRDSSGTGRTVTLRPGQSDVRLLLSLPKDEYKSYGATIRNQDAKVITHRDGLRRTRSGKQIAFQFSTAGISSGDYVVSVSGKTPSGSEPITDYAFRLVQAR